MESLAMELPPVTRVSSLETCIDALSEQGWAVWPDFLDTATVAALRGHALNIHSDGGFHRAGVGRGDGLAVREGVRSDYVMWLEDAPPHPLVDLYLDRMDALRQAVNRELFLGLHDLESHFAVYPTGSFYQRHLDRFRDSDLRTLTVVFYLNDDWQADDGGQIRFWPDPAGTGPHHDLAPAGGTLLLFLSDRFWHEVLPTRRQRLSITGWFRRRPA